MGIRLKELSKLGYTNNVARSLAINIISKHCKHDTKEEIGAVLSDLLNYPDKYKTNEIWSKLVEHFSPTLEEKCFRRLIYSTIHCHSRFMEENLSTA